MSLRIARRPRAGRTALALLGFEVALIVTWQFVAWFFALPLASIAVVFLAGIGLAAALSRLVTRPS